MLHDSVDAAVALELQQLIGLQHTIAMFSAVSDAALDAIAQASRIVFVVSEHSTREGSQALQLLDAVRRRWPVARGRVIPVLVGELNLSSIPAYLAAVNILRPRGPVEQIADLIREHEQRRRVLTRRLAWGAGWLIVLIAALAAGIKRWNDRPPSLRSARAAAEADAWALETASALGHRGAFVADRWIVGETPVTAHDLLIPLLVDGLRARRPALGDGDLLIALYSRDPRAVFSFVVTPGNLMKQPTSSMMASIPLPVGANSIESSAGNARIALGNRSLIGWMLSFAPYLGSVAGERAAWICHAFPLAPAPDDSGPPVPNAPPVLRKVKIELPGCSVREFPIYGPPPTVPFPPPPLDPAPPASDTAVNQLRAVFFLPRDTDSAVLARMDTLRIVATPLGFAQAASGIAMLLWVDDSPDRSEGGTP